MSWSTHLASKSRATTPIAKATPKIKMATTTAAMTAPWSVDCLRCLGTVGGGSVEREKEKGRGRGRCMHECLMADHTGLCAHACQWHPLVKDVLSTSRALCNKCAILPTQRATFKLHTQQTHPILCRGMTSQVRD